MADLIAGVGADGNARVIDGQAFHLVFQLTANGVVQIIGGRTWALSFRKARLTTGVIDPVAVTAPDGADQVALTVPATDTPAIVAALRSSAGLCEVSEVFAASARPFQAFPVITGSTTDLSGVEPGEQDAPGTLVRYDVVTGVVTFSQMGPMGWSAAQQVSRALPDELPNPTDAAFAAWLITKAEQAVSGPVAAAQAAAKAAGDSATAANTSAGNAKSSETNAGASAGNAKTSETNAGASAAAANTSAGNAKSSENNAGTSAGNAKTSETNAGTSAGNAKTSETNASTSAGAAAGSATAAAGSAGAAAGSATAAGGSAALVQTIANTGVGKVLPTWAALQTIVGNAYDGAIVLDGDTGQHTDPVSGATVSNAGTYRYVAGSPAGWQWASASTASTVQAALALLTSSTVSYDPYIGAARGGVGRGALPGVFPGAHRIMADQNGRMVQAWDANDATLLTIPGAMPATDKRFMSVLPGVLPGMSFGVVDAAGRVVQAFDATGAATVTADALPNTDKRFLAVLPGVLPGTSFGLVDAAGRLAQSFDATGAATVTAGLLPTTDKRLLGVLPGVLIGAAVAYADQNGRLVQSLDGYGQPTIAQATTATLPVTDSRMQGALPGAPYGGFTGSDGSLILGYEPDSTLSHFRPAEPNGLAYQTGTSPNRQVRAVLASGADILVSMPGADPSVFTQNRNTISYMRTVAAFSGDVVPRMETVSIAKERFTAGVSRVAIVPVYGQSNASGYGHRGSPAGSLSTTPVAPGRVKAPTAGARLTDQSSPGSPIAFSDINRWRDLAEKVEGRSKAANDNPGETPCSGIAWALTQSWGLAATDMIAICSAAIGSQSVSRLSKSGPTTHYANLIRWVHQETVRALANGLTPYVAYVY